MGGCGALHPHERHVFSRVPGEYRLLQCNPRSLESPLSRLTLFERTWEDAPVIPAPIGQRSLNTALEP